MSLIPPWLRLPRVRERLASYDLRSDVLDAAAAMASDQRSDIYVVRLESSLTNSETVLRMMDGRHARVMGLLVLTSERILFRSRRRSGPNFSVPLEEVLAIEVYTRRGTGTVRVITPYGSLTIDQILGRQGRCSPMTPKRQSAVNLCQTETRSGYWPNSAHCAPAGRSAPPSSRSTSLRSDATRHLGDRSGVAIPGTGRHTGSSAPQRWATWGR
jgi:hypothetical protein